jgi:hypothetical protein
MFFLMLIGHWVKINMLQQMRSTGRFVEAEEYASAVFNRIY